MRLLALALLLSARADDSPYHFEGKLLKIVTMSEFKGTAAVADLDPRWVVEFEPVKTLEGAPPKGDDGTVRYAIHSPALRGLTDQVGSVFQIKGALVGKEGNRRHQIEIQRKTP